MALIPDVKRDARQESRTLESLAAQGAAVAAWIGGPEALPTEAPTETEGAGATLNALLGATESELVLVVEPGQELFSNCVQRLLQALDAAPEAVAAYGFMADPTAGELWNALPLEGERLERRAYLTAPFLIRRSTLLGLGGFSEDPVLSGYEYHDLWCRVARRGHAAAFVQQILGRGARPRPTGSAIAALAPEVSLEALQRTDPTTR